MADEYTPLFPPSRPIATVPDTWEIETLFLGAIFHNGDVVKKYGHLSPADFHYSALGKMWEIIRDAADRGEPISLATLKGRFEGLPDARKLIDYFSVSFSCAIDLDHWANDIKSHAVRRLATALMPDLESALCDTNQPAEESISRVVGVLNKILADTPAKGITKRQVAESLVRRLDLPHEKYSTGIVSIDRVMGGGMYAGRMYATAARKKVGKTILLGTVSHNLSRAQVPHLFLAMETPAAEIEQRNAAREQRFNSIRFLTRDDPRLADRVAEYAISQGHTTTYEDCPGATFDQIRAIVGRHLAAGKIKGVILDYLQLVGGKAKNETEEYHLRAVAQWLADLARRESLFVLVAAQVNQDGNTRGGEGLRLAADQYYTLHRDVDDSDAWLEMGESRYTLYQNVGSATVPGLILDPHGPHFRDATSTERERAA